MAIFPIVMSTAGYVPQSPDDLHTKLIQTVQQTNPEYTANLPGILIEDISSTDVYAMLQMDSSIAELINSITPYGANEFLLNQLGNVFGITPQSATNTSVYVQFSGPPGWVIVQGFVVGDGNYQYTVQDGGIIGAGGTSDDIFCVSDTSGTWAVPAGTVTQLVTSVPTGVNLTVNNNFDGIPATAAENAEDYRARVLQAGYSPSQSMATYLKTLLWNVPGVSKRLVSVRQVDADPKKWEVICGGGDQYAVAEAIFNAGLILSSLTGSVMEISGITNANPGVVTTVLDHNLPTGKVIYISGCQGIAGVNNVPLTITAISSKTFSIGINTTLSGAYTGGGVVDTNPRNITVPVFDYPDTYSITYVNPPLQTTAVTVVWNTIATNFISPIAVAQLMIPSIVSYINSIVVGQPINLLTLNTAIQESVKSLLPSQLLTRLVISVSINGNGVSPLVGTSEIPGDPESYFYTDATLVTVSQG